MYRNEIKIASTGWILADPTSHPTFKPISGHANALFATWAPELYDYYHTHLGPLFARNPKLRRPFPQSVWTVTSPNFGLTREKNGKLFCLSLFSTLDELHL